MTVINLFGEVGAVHPYERPDVLLSRMAVPAGKYSKALVILIDDKAGMWDTNWEAAGMTNAEVTLSLDIIHRTVMDTVLGKG